METHLKPGVFWPVISLCVLIPPDLISSASLHRDSGDVDGRLGASRWDKCRVHRAVRTVAALGFLSRQSREPESANQHAEAPPQKGLWVK